METITLKPGGPFQTEVLLELLETHNCIVGMNGSGKTALAKALSNYFIKKCGEYSIPNLNIEEISSQTETWFEDKLRLIQERGISKIQFTELLKSGLKGNARLRGNFQYNESTNAYREIISFYSSPFLASGDRFFLVLCFYIALIKSTNEKLNKKFPLILDEGLAVVDHNHQVAIKDFLQSSKIQYVLLTSRVPDLDVFKPTHVIQVRGAGRDASPMEIVSGVPLFCADGDRWESTLVTLPGSISCYTLNSY